MASRQPVPIKAAAPIDPNLVTLKLAGDYAGQEVTARPKRLRIKHLRAIEDAGDNNQIKAMTALIGAVIDHWTMRDEETGELLPQPADGGLDELTMAQIGAISAALNAHAEAVTAPPKA